MYNFSEQNLYDRNCYKYIYQYKLQNMYIDNVKIGIAYGNTIMNKLFFHKIYLNYIEIPITTKCSLKCKECSNLIQFYQKPYHISAARIKKDIDRLSRIVDGIGMIRVLGGEPMLHPDLPDILEYMIHNPKIQKVQIVTNGTLLCNEALLRILKKNQKTSIDISYYGKSSIKYKEFICQLRKNQINHCSNRNLKWTRQSDFSYRGRNKSELAKAFQKCKMDCISMLNGEIHLCPRSSTGKDLKAFEVADADYVNLRKGGGLKKKRKELFCLLNTNYIRACNYCDVFQAESLEECIPGEQITRQEAAAIFNQTKQCNDARRQGCIY